MLLTCNERLYLPTHCSSSQRWESWLLNIGSEEMFVNQKPAMIIAPHQDDEVLGCGGLIALKRERNVPVQVIFITDGAASHGRHPKFQSGELVSIRKQEAILALSILGIDKSQIYFLDKPDSQLQYLDASDAYGGLRLRQQTIKELAKLLKSFQPGEVYVTHRQDGIKDHEVTYELLVEAIQYSGIEADVLEYPIWMFWMGDQKLNELALPHSLSIHSVQSKKIEALAVYRSQCLPIDARTPAVLKPEFLRRFFLPYEIFFNTKLPKCSNKLRDY